MRPLDAAAIPDDAPLDDALRTAVIEEALEQIGRHYLFPGVAAEVVAAIRRRLAAGAYDGITGAGDLAQTLTAHLQAASHDRHLSLLYPAPPRPPGGVQPGGPPTPEELAARRREAVLDNFGIRRVERLAGDVGYLDLRRFWEPEVAGEALVAAMRLVVDTLALVLDLRRNGGGQPGTVTLLCSYLLGPQPVHFCDIRWRVIGNRDGSDRCAERTEQAWTLPYVPGARYGADRPVYVLTSRDTFSGAEAVAFCLQQRKRATVVGERTGGGAHLSSGISIRDRFGLSVPTGRAVDPLTGTNWEGSGVAPDVEVPAAAALAVAHAAALRHVLATFGDVHTRAGRALQQEAGRALADLEGATTG